MAVGTSKRLESSSASNAASYGGQKQTNFVDQDSVEGVSLEARRGEMGMMSQVPWKEIEVDLRVVAGR